MRISLLSRFLMLPFFVFMFMRCDGDYVPAYESNEVDVAPFVRFDEPVIPIIDIYDPNSKGFTNRLIDPGGGVETFEIWITFQKRDSTYRTVSMVTIDDFPYELSIGPDDVIEAYNGMLTEEDIDFGDQLIITSTSTNENGREFTSNDFNNDLSDGYEQQAFDYTLVFGCPFNVNDVFGEYYVYDESELFISLDPGRPIKLVAGEEENSFIFLNMFSHPEKYDIEIKIDDLTGRVTVPRQLAVNTDNIGLGFGELGMVGSGNFYTCIGILNLTVQPTSQTLDAGITNITITKID